MLDISVYFSLKQKSSTFWNVELRYFVRIFFFFLNLHTTHFISRHILSTLIPAYVMISSIFLVIFREQCSPLPLSKPIYNICVIWVYFEWQKERKKKKTLFYECDYRKTDVNVFCPSVKVLPDDRDNDSIVGIKHDSFWFHMIRPTFLCKTNLGCWWWTL